MFNTIVGSSGFTMYILFHRIAHDTISIEKFCIQHNFGGYVTKVQDPVRKRENVDSIGRIHWKGFE